MSESLPAAAHADHLTEILLKSGELGNGRVCNVVVENSRATILSTITRLRLTYVEEDMRGAKRAHGRNALPIDVHDVTPSLPDGSAARQGRRRSR
jgi:hypothetical protein